MQSTLDITTSRQASLPLFSQAAPVGESAEGALRAFAHPAEQEVARLLTFFGLRWTYEPTTFALRRHPDGTIAEAFSPDFFLPDLHLYLELTTMRQKLVTRKNRKARLLRELYPNVNLRLIYRRDYLRMMECYRSEMRRSDGAEFVDVVRTQEEIASALDQIAYRIVARLQRAGLSQARPVILLVTNNGSRHLQQDVADRLRQLGQSVELQGLELIGEDEVVARPRIRATAASLARLQDGPVVLLETLVSTGLTLGHAQRWLRQRNVYVMETAALLARSSCQIGNVRIDHVAFEAPNEVVAGYGLQLRAKHSDLPYIGKVRASAGSTLDLPDHAMIFN